MDATQTDCSRPEPIFGEADFERALSTLDLIFQNHDWSPGENYLQGVCSALCARGVTLALARALIRRLIDAGVFRHWQRTIPAGTTWEDGWPVYRTEPERIECLITTYEDWCTFLASHKQSVAQSPKSFEKDRSGQRTSQRATVPVNIPANASWTELRVRFVDGHTVSIKIGRFSQVLNYAQLGFADGRNSRPNKQWELLQTLANNHGMLAWGQPGASRTQQKRRENLALQLKRALPLSGEPIELTEDGKGWRTVFHIESDH
jgi:hypothetical protein